MRKARVFGELTDETCLELAYAIVALGNHRNRSISPDAQTAPLQLATSVYFERR
jgi:hypothetical protein